MRLATASLYLLWLCFAVSYSAPQIYKYGGTSWLCSNMGIKCGPRNSDLFFFSKENHRESVPQFQEPANEHMIQAPYRPPKCPPGQKLDKKGSCRDPFRQGEIRFGYWRGLTDEPDRFIYPLSSTEEVAGDIIDLPSRISKCPPGNRIDKKGRCRKIYQDEIPTGYWTELPDEPDRFIYPLSSTEEVPGDIINLPSRIRKCPPGERMDRKGRCRKIYRDEMPTGYWTELPEKD